MLTDVVETEVPGSVGLFVRVKDVLRVIQLLDLFHVTKHGRAVHLRKPRTANQTVAVLARYRAAV